MNPKSTSPLELGGSLPVPSVQELARSGEIPERYLRPEEDHASHVITVDDLELPVIDQVKLVDPEFFDKEEHSRLGWACRECGFFQLANHGIPEELIEKTKDDIMKFFKLPKKIEGVKQIPGHIDGYDQMFVHSEEQKIDWADVLIPNIQPFQNRDMTFWPTNPPGIHLTHSTLKIEKVADHLYRLMAKDLGVNPQDMLNIFSGQIQSRESLSEGRQKKSSMSNPLVLGRSLPVPNVQELARSDQIPERYLKPEVDATSLATIDDDELPVIDLMKLLDPELIDREELLKLGSACKEWGFFQIINHGIPEEVIEKTKDDINKFFKLPLKEKEAIKQIPGHIEGYGQMFVHSEEQKLDWADVLILGILPSQNRDLRFWPTNPSTFRDTLDTYTSKVARVVDSLYGLMAKDLGVDTQDMLKMSSDQLQTVRINYYPPCKQANKVLGLSPHSDANALTVLLQANDVPGLQIRKNDKWFLIKPKPGAFIINVGDMMEIITNGRYKSIEHRAIINMEEERLSIATFHSPRLDLVLRPFPELIDSDGELYKAITVKEYTSEYFAGKLNGKNALESVKLRK
ncbi:hypothetical protein IEQ34_006411 [Dendrobium chrysotoxum]|uniref:Fe2OG dioxygenase domain-containing protein n=1 Tax=Dendrobium chrysotoxum TaxID=161865 RepID=A0AAV7HFS9_DENCH|nr:hypothetical protein IEQ34_006411 [Dendrobium chrysotoxum]